MNESKTLKYSMIGAFILAVWGISMAVIAQSGAILLDGAFNLISAIVSFFSIKVTILAAKGSSKKYPLGYYSFESLIVLIKGTSMLVLIAIAIASNLPVLLSGGRDPALGLMALYVFPAVVGCLILYKVCDKGYQNAGSDILKAEKQAWLINAVISGAIGLALVIVLIIQSTSFAWIARYIDQILVILFSLVFIRDPLNLVRSGFKELLLATPDKAHMAPIEEKLETLTREHDIKVLSLDVIKTGRKTWVTLVVEPDHDEINMNDFMALKNQLQTSLQSIYPDSNAEILLDRQSNYP